MFLVAASTCLECVGQAAIGEMTMRNTQRGYGATVARLTPDQKVGSSNLSALNLQVLLLKLSNSINCRLVTNQYRWLYMNTHLSCSHLGALMILYMLSIAKHPPWGSNPRPQG